MDSALLPCLLCVRIEDLAFDIGIHIHVMDPPPHSFPPGYLNADIGDRVIAVSVAFIPTCLVFIGLRFYSQWLRTAPRGLDDLFVVISGLMLLGWSAIGICESSYMLSVQSVSNNT